ncbi:MAG: Beta-lactamase, partial [Chitinophagaceae bacterium]|nr:Beta-lactamase [Chitinophagaceae bacterium]
KAPSNPASTFKIINALIALEEGILKDEKEIVKFVGIENVDTSYYGNRTEIFKDMDLEEAFKKSAVWFNIEIAKKVGREKYRKYITACSWGNMDFSESGVDFWNFGPFTVTPVQQIEFLQKLYAGKLGFSKRNLEIVKRIMIAESTTLYTIRGKTGWATTATEDLGWWVGYVEREEGIVFFATRTRKQKIDKNLNFVPCRKTITTAVLKQLTIIK